MLKFLTLTIGVVATTVALGYGPTVTLAGPDAVWPMVAGCLTSAVASWAGAVPIAVAQWKQPSKAVGDETGTGGSITTALTLSMVVRFLVVGALALSVALGGGLSKPPYLIWVGISYMLLLVVDTLFAMQFGRVAWRRAQT
ncbi:MAG: hypothetical protein ACE5E5_12430 [Phycisphaerae bacterium]